MTLLTAGADPGARTPAPGSLQVIQALVNTLNQEARRDLLTSPADAAGWLAAAGLLPAGSAVTDAERLALVDLRESLRAVLAGHTDRAPDAGAAGRLTMALRPCRLAVSVDAAGGVRLASADHDPFSRAIGAVAVVIAEAAVAGTWERLKCCPGHLCGWAFYDRSASGRSRWCSMQLCGSRAKMRAYRGRGS